MFEGLFGGVHFAPPVALPEIVRGKAVREDGFSGRRPIPPESDYRLRSVKFAILPAGASAPFMAWVMMSPARLEARRRDSSRRWA